MAEVTVTLPAGTWEVVIQALMTKRKTLVKQNGKRHDPASLRPNQKRICALNEAISNINSQLTGETNDRSGNQGSTRNEG